MRTIRLVRLDIESIFNWRWTFLSLGWFALNVIISVPDAVESKRFIEIGEFIKNVFPLGYTFQIYPVQMLSWIAFVIMTMYPVILYIEESVNHGMINTLVRTGNVTLWWSSKLIAAIFYLAVLMTVVVLNSAFLAKLSFPLRGIQIDAKSVVFITFSLWQRLAVWSTFYFLIFIWINRYAAFGTVIVFIVIASFPVHIGSYQFFPTDDPFGIRDVVFGFALLGFLYLASLIGIRRRWMR